MSAEQVWHEWASTWLADYRDGTPTPRMGELRAALAACTEQQPPRPEPGEDDDGFPTLPDGWASVVMGMDPADQDGSTVVLCGWTSAGVFVQYAPTEAIVSVCTQALQEAHHG